MNMNELAAPDFPIESQSLASSHWLSHELTEAGGTHRADRLDCEPPPSPSSVKVRGRAAMLRTISSTNSGWWYPNLRFCATSARSALSDYWEPPCACARASVCLLSTRPMPASICAHERMSSKDMDKLEQIEAYMRANLDKPLSNTLLCALFCVSEYRLKECFRQAYGTSPNQHLQEMRMHRAREMLASGCQVAETAYRLGYQHPNNLSAAFIRAAINHSNTITAIDCHETTTTGQRGCCAFRARIVT